MKTTSKKRILLSLLMGASLMFMISCGKGDDDEITPQVIESMPTVTTYAVTDIGTNNAKSGGNVTNDGNCQVITRGICWSKTNNPSLQNNIGKTIDGSGTGSFSSSLSSLDDETYFIRAYAINCQGTAYGASVIFKTFHQPIRVEVTNLNISEGDQPSVSGMPDGLDFKKVNYHSSILLTIGYSENPKIYIWTCYDNNPCNWKPYSVPTYTGGCYEYYEGGRKLKICRVGG